MPGSMAVLPAPVPRMPWTGRRGLIGPGTYNLDEAELGGGFYAQDSWRVRPDLTFNYGLRWDLIQRPARRQERVYRTIGSRPVRPLRHSQYLPARSELGSSKSAVHHFRTQIQLEPCPASAAGWLCLESEYDRRLLGKIFGAGKTVIRGSYTIKNYTEGGQNFWAGASNSGYNFFNSLSTTASNTVAPQNFTPGTVNLVAPTACPNPVQNCVNVASAAALPPLFRPRPYIRQPFRSRLCSSCPGSSVSDRSQYQAAVYRVLYIRDSAADRTLQCL